MVENTNSEGIRTYWSRFRFVMTHASLITHVRLVEGFRVVAASTLTVLTTHRPHSPRPDAGLFVHAPWSVRPPRPSLRPARSGRGTRRRVSACAGRGRPRPRPQRRAAAAPPWSGPARSPRPEGRSWPPGCRPALRPAPG